MAVSGIPAMENVRMGSPPPLKNNITITEKNCKCQRDKEEFGVNPHRDFCKYQGDCRECKKNKKGGHRARGGNTDEYRPHSKDKFEITVYVP